MNPRIIQRFTTYPFTHRQPVPFLVSIQVSAVSVFPSCCLQQRLLSPPQKQLVAFNNGPFPLFTCFTILVVYSRQSQHTLIIHRRLNTATFPCTPQLICTNRSPPLNQASSFFLASTAFINRIRYKALSLSSWSAIAKTKAGTGARSRGSATNKQGGPSCPSVFLPSLPFPPPPFPGFSLYNSRFHGRQYATRPYPAGRFSDHLPAGTSEAA